MHSNAPTVGFDLDMTLIDSRPGIKAAFLALSAETGFAIDADLAISRSVRRSRTSLPTGFRPT